MGCPDLSTFAHLLYVATWSTQAEDSSNDYRVAKCHGHGGYIPVKNTQKQRVEPFLIRVNFGLSICSVQSCKMSWRSRIYPCQKGGKKAKKKALLIRVKADFSVFSVQKILHLSNLQQQGIFSSGSDI